MISCNRIKYFLFFLFFSICSGLLSQSVENGESIYKANCTSCHYTSDKKLIGPGLQGVTDKRSKEWLKLWINDNAALRASGDADAIAIFEEYNGSIMQAFYFSDDDFEDLYAYLVDPPVEESSQIIASEDLDNLDEVKNSNTDIYLLILLLVILIVLLSSVKNNLEQSLNRPSQTILQVIISVVSDNKSKFIIFVFTFVYSLKIVYGLMLGIGDIESYQPSQPIMFSHKIHAGENGVDCNYCHSSARKSKHSGVPSANVCMNCHTYIQEGPNYGTTEIGKIYDAVGFDPETRTYIEGYQQKPIEWIRVHQLPDLAYFNHSQHVNVAGLECQQCHGDMQNKTVGQVATTEELNNQENNIKDGIEFGHPTLSMGWCIDCHRQKEVDLVNNDYYMEVHEKLLKKHGEDTKITVDMIGGLECGKCHY